jgi:peptidyl-prolyl cis-trans isomerase SurA
MRILRVFALTIVTAALFPAAAQSAEPLPSLPTLRSGDPIAAVVNDDVITQRDVEQRTRLALLSSNLPDTPDMRTRVLGSLLRRMIDEDLKIQAASKAKITVSASDITAQMESIEQQNHLPAGGLVKLLTSKEIEPEALRQQVRAEIAWARLVGHVLARDVHISENAVTTRLDAIRANLGKPEYHVSEIYLDVESEKDEAEARDLAERLVDQIQRGAPFAAIARQFNQSGAAEGNLGWVSEGMLDDDLLAALGQLQLNGVTAPIRTTDGYHILMLLEKRKVGEGMGIGPTVDLMTIDLNSLSSSNQAERDLQMKHLRDILTPAKSCDDLVRLSQQVPSAATTLAEKLPESQLPAKVASLIKDLAPGHISEPIDVPKGRRFFAVCARAPGTTDGLPSAETIRRHMEEEQLQLVARRYLVTLHRGAVIDIRS